MYTTYIYTFENNKSVLTYLKLSMNLAQCNITGPGNYLYLTKILS